MNLDKVLTEKREFAKLIVIAALLAFGVNALAGFFVETELLPFWVKLLLPALLIIASVIYVIRDVFGTLEFEETIDAALFLDSKETKPIAIKDYSFSEKLSRALNAVFLESKSLEKEWNDSPINRVLDQKLAGEECATTSSAEKPNAKSDVTYIAVCKMDVDEKERKLPTSTRLLEETVVYILLEELSLHLSTYFNDKDEDEYIYEYKRADIPAFLLNNRVLSLLSTPLEQRDIFLNAFPDPKKRPPGEIYTLYGSNGSIYSRFDLILPLNTKIKQIDSNTISIETSRISIEIHVSYQGFVHTVAHSFIGLYMRRDPENIDVRNIKVSLKGKIKPTALLFNSGWEYYRWLDSFKDRFKEFGSFDTFLKTINWETIETFMFVNRPSSQKGKKNNEETKAT